VGIGVKRGRNKFVRTWRGSVFTLVERLLFLNGTLLFYLSEGIFFRGGVEERKRLEFRCVKEDLTLTWPLLN